MCGCSCGVAVLLPDDRVLEWCRQCCLLGRHAAHLACLLASLLPPRPCSSSGGAPEQQQTSPGGNKQGGVKVVLITGFESFNVELYKKAAVQLARVLPGMSVRVFSDRDLGECKCRLGWMGNGWWWMLVDRCALCAVLSALCCARLLRAVLESAAVLAPPVPAVPPPPAGPRRAEVEAALEGADVFFGSLLFDFDQVEWLRARVARVPVRLVFESSLELMESTQVGGFQMAQGGKSKGPPPAVKKVGCQSRGWAAAVIWPAALRCHFYPQAMPCGNPPACCPIPLHDASLPSSPAMHPPAGAEPVQQRARGGQNGGLPILS